jgi:hypothetical protein
MREFAAQRMNFTNVVRRADGTMGVDTAVRPIRNYVLTSRGEILVALEDFEWIKHTSIAGGNDVWSAGQIGVENSQLRVIDLQSGHYIGGNITPGSARAKAIIQFTEKVSGRTSMSFRCPIFTRHFNAFGAEEMIMVDVIDLLNKNYDTEHGVVNVRPVVDELVKIHPNPFEELRAKFKSVEVRWHSPILEAMRQLAATGRCSESGAHEILLATDTVARETGHDEFFKTINALAVSPTTAPTLVKFVYHLLNSGKEFDRRLAFYAVGMLLEHNGSRLLSDGENVLRSAAEAEESPELKRDFTDLLYSLREAR